MQFSEERKWQRNKVTNWKLELFEYLRSSRNLGAPVHVVANGKVVEIDNRWEGISVLVKHNHEGIEYWSQYSHLQLQSIAVCEGQMVRRGEHIGDIGNTSGGPHLHFEMRSQKLDVNNWPSGKTPQKIEELGYLNPTDESSPCETDTGCGTYTQLPGFINAHQPDPNNVTVLMEEYRAEDIINNELNKNYIERRVSFECNQN